MVVLSGEKIDVADKGRRLDHIWVTSPIKTRVKAATVLRQAREGEGNRLTMRRLSLRCKPLEIPHISANRVKRLSISLA